MRNKRGKFGSFKMPVPAKVNSLPDDATTEQIIDRLRADVAHEKQTFQAMGIVSNGGDVRLLAAERLQQFVNYAEVVKQKRTLEGYDIERLKLVATILEQQSITPEDLRKLTDNLTFAMETVIAIAAKTQEITQTCLRLAAIAEAELAGKER